MKCLVKTALNPYSGYGNDGIGIVRALLSAGVDVYIDPAYVAPPLPPDIAKLFTKRLQAPFDLLLQHVDPGQMGISREARRAAKTAIGWTMWEYSSLDNLKGRTTLRKRLKDFDLVLGYDTVTTGALSPYVPEQKLATLQGGFWPQQWPQASRDWRSDRFGFCMVGQLHERKDPFIAIQAFKELKDELGEEFDGAELHLKTNTPGLHMAMEQWVSKLRVHYDVWPHEVLQDFYASQHVLLAPSRGEGKNVPALEFMATGGTVVATNWGGHAQWLSPSYAYPLDYTLKPIRASLPNCLSARASKEHLKELMLHVYRNRDEAAAKGATAARLIPEMCSWDAVVRRLFDRVSEVIPDGGRLTHDFRAGQERQRQKTRVPAYA